MRRQTVFPSLLAAGSALILSAFLQSWLLRVLLGLALLVLAFLSRDGSCG